MLQQSEMKSLDEWLIKVNEPEHMLEDQTQFVASIMPLVLEHYRFVRILSLSNTLYESQPKCKIDLRTTI
jgi:hypothetical protein